MEDGNKKNNIRPYWGSHPGSQPRKNRSVCIRQLRDLRRSESGGLAIGTLRSPPKYSGWIVLCSRGRDLGRWITRLDGLSRPRDFGPSASPFAAGERDALLRYGERMCAQRDLTSLPAGVASTWCCGAASAGYRTSIGRIERFPDGIRDRAGANNRRLGHD